MEDDVLDLAGRYLPKYLSPAKTSELYDALKQFPNINPFYMAPQSQPETPLQGDGWRGLLVFNFRTGDRKKVVGLFLTNSCDMSLDNRSALPRMVVFSPLVSVSQFCSSLSRRGQTAQQIEGLMANIRKQKVTDVFYLPAQQHGPPESLVLLSAAHSHPVRDLVESGPTRVFCLSQAAFYLFVVKLSIHFCRLQEGYAR